MALESVSFGWSRRIKMYVFICALGWNGNRTKTGTKHLFKCCHVWIDMAVAVFWPLNAICTVCTVFDRWIGPSVFSRHWYRSRPVDLHCTARYGVVRVSRKKHRLLAFTNLHFPIVRLRVYRSRRGHQCGKRTVCSNWETNKRNWNTVVFKLNTVLSHLLM